MLVKKKTHASMASIWKQQILFEEAQNGSDKNLTERRLFNRYLTLNLKGGGNSNFKMLQEVARLEGGMKGGGWTDYLSKANMIFNPIAYAAEKATAYTKEKLSNVFLYKASESMELWKKLTEKAIPGFCKLLETRLASGGTFPVEAWAGLNLTLRRACENKDIQAVMANRDQTANLMQIFKKDAKGQGGKMGFFRRIWNCIRNNKMKIFSVSTILFIAYLAWCYFTAGIGCALAGQVFAAGNWAKSALGLKTAAQAAAKSGNFVILGDKPVLVFKEVATMGVKGVLKLDKPLKFVTKLAEHAIQLRAGGSGMFYDLMQTYLNSKPTKDVKYTSMWLLWMQHEVPSTSQCGADEIRIREKTEKWLEEGRNLARTVRSANTVRSARSLSRSLPRSLSRSLPRAESSEERRDIIRERLQSNRKITGETARENRKKRRKIRKSERKTTGERLQQQQREKNLAIIRRRQQSK